MRTILRKFLCFPLPMAFINEFIFVIVLLCCCVSVVKSADVEITSIPETLLCRRCGHEITSSQHINNIGSKLALRQRNDTILGDKMCLIQLFENPNGHQFELITAKSASLLLHGEPHLEHSWFPDYAWRIATCPQCGAHLGWSFENPKDINYHLHPDDNHSKMKKRLVKYSFVGLIFPNLIQQNYADSLIVMPKAYRG